MSARVLVLAALSLAPAGARADVRVVYETEEECPSSGELLEALGPGFGLEGERRVSVRFEVRADGRRVSVHEDGRAPVDRVLPEADCATTARLVAIIVRGYVRDAPPPSSPPPPAATPSVVPFGALALGAALEIDPANGAFALALRAGLAIAPWRLRLVLSGTSSTGIGQLAPVERLAMQVRADAGWIGAIERDLELGGWIGLGTFVALVRVPEPAIEAVRAAPVIGLYAHLGLRLVGPLWLEAELGGDVPFVRDVYVVVHEDAARAPALVTSALVGLALRGI